MACCKGASFALAPFVARFTSGPACPNAADSVYVLALYEADSSSSQQEAQQWVDRTAARVQALAAAGQAPAAAGAEVQPAGNGSVLQPQANGVSRAQAVRGSAEQLPAATKQQQRQQAERPPAGAFQLREGRQRYLKNVAGCMQVRTSANWALPEACWEGEQDGVLDQLPFRPTFCAAHCQLTQALYDGESYEVCLTTMLSRRGSVPPAQQLYRTLRRVNPAPYAGGCSTCPACAGSRLCGGYYSSKRACALCCCQYLHVHNSGLRWLVAEPMHPTPPLAAWLRIGGGAAALQLCCCSPERFLRGGRGSLLEAKPIKGTAPRSSNPEQDARAAAELAGRVTGVVGVTVKRGRRPA